MKPFKFLSLFLVIFFIQNTYAQKVVLYYKDGSKKTGVGKLKKLKYIKFKEEGKSTKKIDFNELKRAVIYKKKNKIVKTYVQLYLIDMKKETVVQVVSVGKINLYRRDTYASSTPITNYYLGSNNVNQIYHFDPYSKKEFKEFIGRIGNCQRLIDKILTKEYKKKDIEKIVNYYNTNCY